MRRSPARPRHVHRRVLPAAHGAHRRWSRRSRWPTSPTARRRSGRRSRAPTARARTSPRRSACRSRTSPSMSRCSAAASGASRSATSCSRRRSSRRRSARAGAGAVDARGRHPALASTTPPRSSGSRRRSMTAARSPAGAIAASRPRSSRPSQEDNGYQFPIEYGMGFVDMPFDIPNVRCENGQAMAHTRIGWFRSVSNIPRAFAVQSFAAELANELGRDPKDFLLELIGPDRDLDPKAPGFPEDFWNYGEPYDEFPIDTARLQERRRARGGEGRLGQAAARGRGLGIAAHRSFVTLRRDRRAREGGRRTAPSACRRCTPRSTAASPPIPERIRSQIEGAAVMGMTLALYSAITFKNGARAAEQLPRLRRGARSTTSPQVVVTHIVEHPFDGARRRASASRACRRSRRRSTTRSSTRPASASARCRWAISLRHSLVARRSQSKGARCKPGPLADFSK